VDDVLDAGCVGADALEVDHASGELKSVSCIPSGACTERSRRPTCLQVAEASRRPFELVGDRCRIVDGEREPTVPRHVARPRVVDHAACPSSKISSVADRLRAMRRCAGRLPLPSSVSPRASR